MSDHINKQADLILKKFKAKTVMDAGFVYAPYVPVNDKPIKVYKDLDEETWVKRFEKFYNKTENK